MRDGLTPKERLMVEGVLGEKAELIHAVLCLEYQLLRCMGLPVVSSAD